MNLKLVTSIFLALFISNNIYAHGMDAPGPHGGNITMPGAFHVELKEDKKNSELRIYLLDIAFKNPTVIDSSITVSINNKESLSCKTQKGYYSCNVKSLKNGDSIFITPVRQKVKGTVATYQYPLKY